LPRFTRCLLFTVVVLRRLVVFTRFTAFYTVDLVALVVGFDLRLFTRRLFAFARLVIYLIAVVVRVYYRLVVVGCVALPLLHVVVTVVDYTHVWLLRCVGCYGYVTFTDPVTFTFTLPVCLYVGCGCWLLLVVGYGWLRCCPVGRLVVTLYLHLRWLPFGCVVTFVTVTFIVAVDVTYRLTYSLRVLLRCWLLVWLIWLVVRLVVAGLPLR